MSERPTQAEIDEANASHAQDVEEAEVLALAKECFTIYPTLGGGEFAESELFEFASKLRAKDAATIAQLTEELSNTNIELDAMNANYQDVLSYVKDLKAQLAEAQRCRTGGSLYQKVFMPTS